MAPLLRGFIVSLIGTSLLLSAPAPSASAEGAGGVLAQPGQTIERSPKAGGAEYGSSLRALPGRPRVRVLRLTRSRVAQGSRAALLIDVRRRYASSARVAITLTPRHGEARRLAVRRVRTGRPVRVRLPALPAGRYVVRVQVLAGPGERALPARRMRLVVRAKPKPRSTPRPPTVIPVLQPAPDLPTEPPPAPGLSGGGIFPVQGSYSLGGKDSRFGAARTGHTHEGQDISASSGTPVVAPLAGEIIFNEYQASGAGRYIVLRADNGWDMFFAHLLAGSATLDPGARVTAGQQIGSVGSTGGSSGPHLHFEIWPLGWRHLKGTRPIDPLPQLRAWAG